MNRDTLDRLTMDLALGELSRDAEELLTAYLQLAESEPGAVELIATVDLARRTMQPSVPAEERPLPVPRFLDDIHREHTIPFPLLLRKAMVIAACLFLGFFAGSRQMTSERSLLRTESSVASAEEKVNESDTFWSVDRLRKNASRSEPSHTESLHWTSPVERPRLGESS